MEFLVQQVPTSLDLYLVRGMIILVNCVNANNLIIFAAMELVGPSKRTICGISFQAAFATGVMLVAAWGAVIDDRKILQLIYGLHSLLLIPHYW